MTTLLSFILLGAVEPQPDLIDRLLLTHTYVVFGTIAVCLILAWGYYVWRLGGLVPYLSNPWPSIFIIGIGGAIGFGAFFIALQAQKYPSLDEIRKTPSWKETYKTLKANNIPDDNLTYDQSVGIVKEGEDEKKPESKTPLFNPLDVKKKGNRQVLMDASQVWRERLEDERHNAVLKAKDVGIAVGLLAVVLGYIVSALRLPKPQYEVYEETPPAPMPSAPPSQGPGDLKFEEGAPPREPGAPQLTPPPSDAPVSDSDDAPLNIDDLEKGYRDFQQRKEDLR